MFNFRNWVWLGCLLASVMAPVHAAKFPTETINISGTVNVNKDPTDNGNVPFGRYIFVGSPQYTGPSSLNSHMRMQFDGNTTGGITWGHIDGHVGLPIGNGFYLVFGIRDERGDIWESDEIQLINVAVKSPGEVMVSVVTDATGTDYVGDFSYNANSIAFINNDVASSNAVCQKNAAYSNNFICAVVGINLHFHVSNSTCQIITAHNMAFIWASLSPSEISNGSAETKTAPVTMRCSNSGGVEPIAVTFTSSTGTYDADQGIVKTSRANLGLQLSWASNGQPVVMDKEIDIPAFATSTEDLSVNAKPVQLGSETILGGNFSTQVTMNIEYR